MEIPNRCIWCLKGKREARFDVSHVVPECVGNESQILPVGIVCKECNQYYGSKIEPVLLSDPVFHIAAVLLRLRDPEDMNEFRSKIFDSSHPAVDEVQRNMITTAKLSSDTFTADIKYCIEGRISKVYELREKAFLSRAVHKIAFESLAWSRFVKEEVQLDIYDSVFNHVREWVRRGNPTNHIRPVVRRQIFDRISTNWEYRLWNFPEFMGMELNLFGDWFFVNLSSSADTAEDDLSKHPDPSQHNYPVWWIGREFKLLT